MAVFCGGARRITCRGQVGLVLHEAAGVARLPAAVGEDHGELGNEDSADGGYDGEPAQVIDEHNHGDYEADGPDAHHQQVPALPEVDVVGQLAPCLRDQVHLRLSAASVTQLHPSTVCLAARCREPALALTGLAHRGHVEALDPHRRHRGAVAVVTPLAS